MDTVPWVRVWQGLETLMEPELEEPTSTQDGHFLMDAITWKG